ncbi:MAG: type I methionyl aminopeptidase [Actinomycetota bacterium]
MIIYKSPEEIARMHKAGEIVADAIAATTAAVRPGITTAELDRIAGGVIREAGATPSFVGYGAGGGRTPFPGSICASINEQVVHGIPGSRVIADGDLVSLDFGAIWDGYHGDAAVTVFAGTPPSEEAEHLVDATRASLEAGIKQVQIGGRLGDIGHAVEQVVEAAGFSVVREYVGHGIGRNLHEDPQIPNYGAAGRGPAIKPGLVIAVEPMVNLGGWETEVLADDWTVVTADGSLSAHFEHTIAVTEDGPEVLTAAR